MFNGLKNRIYSLVSASINALTPDYFDMKDLKFTNEDFKKDLESFDRVSIRLDEKKAREEKVSIILEDIEKNNAWQSSLSKNRHLKLIYSKDSLH